MQKTPVSKYFCRLSRDMDQRGLSGRENMTRSVMTLILEIAVPAIKSQSALQPNKALVSTQSFSNVQLLLIPCRYGVLTDRKGRKTDIGEARNYASDWYATQCVQDSLANHPNKAEDSIVETYSPDDPVGEDPMVLAEKRNLDGIETNVVELNDNKQ